MKKRDSINLKSIVSLIAVILIVLFTKIPAQGVCYTGSFLDTDCDGITDDQEPPTPIYQCSSGQVDPTVICDKSKRDLFVILLPCGVAGGICPTSSSILPILYLDMLSTAAKNNLFITVHQINYPTHVLASTIRNVTDTQKAVRILESLATTQNDLGKSSPGTPNTTSDNAYVYTQKIKNSVLSLCPSTSKPCIDSEGSATNRDQVIAKYIRHTIAHEAGHMMKLRYESDTAIGSHYPSQSNTILDNGVYALSYGGGKKFIIGSQYYTGTQYTPNDRDAATLR